MDSTRQAPFACRSAVARGGGVAAHAHRERRGDAEPDVGHDRRLAPVRGRLPGRLGSGLRGHPPRLRRRRRRLAGDVPAAGRELRVQGGAERRVGRELRSPRGAERREHPAQPRLRRRPSSSTTTTRATGSTDNQSSVIATAPGSFQSELGCAGRLGSGLPPLVAPGPRRRRDLHVRDDRAAGGLVRDEGRDQRELGRELRRRRRPERREHRRSACPR